MVILTYIDEPNQIKEIYLDTLENYDVSNLELHRLSVNDEYHLLFNDAHSIGANFSNTHLRSVYFNDSVFENCCFDDARFVAAGVQNVVFKSCSFMGAKFISSRFTHCDWQDCIFGQNTIHETKFIECQLPNLGL